MPLILSSNVIYHAYRLIAETKIFRLGVSLICLFLCEGRMDWQKSIIQKGIIYYFKYREFSGIFAINNKF